MKLSTIYYIFITLYMMITLLFVGLMEYHMYNFEDHIYIILTWFIIIMFYNTTTLLLYVILSKVLKSIKDKIDIINTFSELPIIHSHHFIQDINNIHNSCNILSIRLLEYRKMILYIQSSLLEKNKIIAERNKQLEDANKQLAEMNTYLATLQKISNKNIETYLKGDQ